MNELRRTFSRQSCLELEDVAEETEDTPPAKRKIAFVDIFTVEGKSASKAEADADPGTDRSELEKSNSFEGGFPVKKPADPATFFAFSIVSTICLNPIFGSIGIYLAVKAKRALKMGDQKRAKRLGYAALTVSLAGICLTLSVIIVTLCLIRPT